MKGTKRKKLQEYNYWTSRKWQLQKFGFFSAWNLVIKNPVGCGIWVEKASTFGLLLSKPTHQVPDWDHQPSKNFTFDPPSLRRLWEALFVCVLGFDSVSVSFVKWVCIILKLKRERGGWRNRENFTKLGVSHCRGREDKKEDRKSRGKERRYFRRRNGGKTKINKGWVSGSGRKKLGGNQKFSGVWHLTRH